MVDCLGCARTRVLSAFGEPRRRVLRCFPVLVMRTLQILILTGKLFREPSLELPSILSG